MPLVNLETFSLEGKSPAELEQRRQEIGRILEALPEGINDPDADIALLQELSIITGTLRRTREAKEPRANGTKAPKSKPSTLKDLEDML